MFQSMPQRCCNTADSSRFRRNTRRSLGLLVAQPTIGHSFPLFSHNPLFFPPNVSLKFFSLTLNSLFSQPFEKVDRFFCCVSVER
jgi:hypothetical protein